MAGQLGQALAPRQLLVTGASVLTWWGVQHLAARRVLSLLFGGERWASRTAEQQHRCSISFTSLFFSLFTVTLGTLGLLFPSPDVVVDPIYGESALIQCAAAAGVGFFIWNIMAENVNGWGGLQNLVHHVCCGTCFFFSQHPFSPRVVCTVMLFEASTPALATFKILQIFEMTGTQLYKASRVLFAVLFFIFRLALGIPLTAGWYWDMYELAHSPNRQVHSHAVFNISLVLPVLFLALNFYWFWQIIRQAVRRGPVSPKKTR